MAEQTLTSFTINSLLIGVLIMGLISSYVLFVNNEGYGSMFNKYPDVEKYNLELNSIYNESKILKTANINSNLSADYNPEVSQSGADKTGNAISINLQDIITLTWTSIGFLGTILFGNIYTGIISVLVSSIIGYLVASYVIKAIRTGYT